MRLTEATGMMEWFVCDWRMLKVGFELRAFTQEGAEWCSDVFCMFRAAGWLA